MMRKLFSYFTKFEIILWLSSVIVVTLSFVLSPARDYLNFFASLIGVTALIFLAKGHIAGQALTVVFSVFYGVISLFFGYYGEMITYLFMTAPIAVMSLISWMRHPFRGGNEVEVSRLSGKKIVIMIFLCMIVTTAFYFILGALGNKNLAVSTVSIATSFIAASFSFMRSPYYALAYAANDIVLIILWGSASFHDISYLPLTACFLMFLFNDIYGFYSWLRMKKRQERSRNI
ncbi:MAG: nicotinamide riboside transporter PnuC [Eubacteriales bacterium]